MRNSRSTRITARQLVVIVAMLGCAIASACTAKDGEVATNTTVGPAATSAPGTTEASDPNEKSGTGTTIDKAGTTSTTKKSAGTTSTTKKSTGTTNTTKKPSDDDTDTTVKVDTPPDAAAFCAKAIEIEELFSDDPEDADDPQKYFDAVVVAFDELTKLATAIAADMQTLNAVFQSSDTYLEVAEAFSDGKLTEVTNRIDEYTLANCGMKM